MVIGIDRRVNCVPETWFDLSPRSEVAVISYSRVLEIVIAER